MNLRHSVAVAIHVDEIVWTQRVEKARDRSLSQSPVRRTEVIGVVKQDDQVFGRSGCLHEPVRGPEVIEIARVVRVTILGRP